MPNEFIYIAAIVILLLIIIGLIKSKTGGTESEMERMGREAKAAKRVQNLSEETKARLQTLLAQNDLIEAIKIYRTETGAGLKESKDAVEAMKRNA